MEIVYEHFRSHGARSQKQWHSSIWGQAPLDTVSVLEDTVEELGLKLADMAEKLMEAQEAAEARDGAGGSSTTGWQSLLGRFARQGGPNSDNGISGVIEGVAGAGKGFLEQFQKTFSTKPEDKSGHTPLQTGLNFAAQIFGGAPSSKTKTTQRSTTKPGKLCEATVVVRKLFDGGFGLKLRACQVTAFEVPEAKEAGWRVGDLVVKVNGNTVQDMSQLKRETSAARGNLDLAPIEFTVLRERSLQSPVGTEGLAAGVVAARGSAQAGAGDAQGVAQGVARALGSPGSGAEFLATVGPAPATSFSRSSPFKPDSSRTSSRQSRSMPRKVSEARMASLLGGGGLDGEIEIAPGAAPPPEVVRTSRGLPHPVDGNSVEGSSEGPVDRE